MVYTTDGMEKYFPATYKPAPTAPAPTYKPTYKPQTVTAPAPLTSFSNDYAAEINKRLQTNPNDPTIAQLTELRNQKINTMGLDSYGKQAQAPQQLAPQPIIPQYEMPDQPSGQPTFDTQGTINQLKEAQIRAQMAALEKQLGNSMSNLDNQQAGLGSIYYDKRNQVAAQSDISAMNFAQRAAARGMSGNAAAMPEIYRNSALQGQLGMLNRDEAGANAGIESNRASLRNNYESDIVSTQAGIEAQALQNYINQMNTDRQFGLQEAGVTGSYQGGMTMAGQSQQLANQMAQLNIEAAEIENSFLPQTLKDEAILLQQQVEQGRIDASTALAKLQQIKNSGSSATPTSKIATTTNTPQTNYYADAQTRLNMLPAPMKLELIERWNTEGKLTDQEATTLLQGHGLI